jgi:hypothetical protein
MEDIVVEDMGAVLMYGRSDTKKSFCLLQVFGSQNSQNVSTATLTRKDGGPGPLAGQPPSSHHPITPFPLPPTWHTSFLVLDLRIRFNCAILQYPLDDLGTDAIHHNYYKYSGLPATSQLLL